MCSRAVPAMLELILVQTTLRGSIVCNRSDKEFRKLRITRAYIKLLCIPEGDARIVSLVRIGNYEVRMLDASQTGSADAPLFFWNCSITTHMRQSIFVSATTSKKEWLHSKNSFRAEEFK